MSRRSMLLEVDGIVCEVVVGWDPPLCEFFGQVWDDPDADAPMIAAAGRIEEVRRRLGAWDLPDQVWDHVRRDEDLNDAETVRRHGA